jgi:hypothetical protein
MAGLWLQTFFIFHDIWDVILPIDELHHFSRWLLHHQPYENKWANTQTWLGTPRTKWRFRSLGKSKATKWAIFQPAAFDDTLCWIFSQQKVGFYTASDLFNTTYLFCMSMSKLGFNHEQNYRDLTNQHQPNLWFDQYQSAISSMEMD